MLCRSDALSSLSPKRIFMVGATGTIGRAALQALIRRGHEVVCFVRPGSAIDADCELRFGSVTDPASIVRDGFRGETFDILFSCMASRSGDPDDAWKIDYQAHVDILKTAIPANVKHVVLLSAICVQKPHLEFQRAKLAFENVLIGSGIIYSIVRPTAFFKSLSGQIDRVKRGKPFLVFGNGKLTSCKPISDDDLAEYLVDCLELEDMQNHILPIGGPGDAITPMEQGEMLFSLLQQKPRFKHVPIRLLDAVIGGLSLLGRVIPQAARKAELARIGRYYATESMLVFDGAAHRYNAASTPATGTQTLLDHYRRVINGEVAVERREHSVF
jgi:divinyl chlorophyllide a 8-vinyl-reductase